MSINQTCLESEIQTAVDNLTTSCSAEVFLETALAADNASVNRKFSVALGCQLPDFQTANIPQGTMVYVEELGVPVVATGLAWKGLDGRLYRQDKTITEISAWGNNASGQLGNNCTVNVITNGVREITSTDNWSYIEAGSFSTNAIKADGTLWSWGSGFLHTLGTNDTFNRSSPVQEISSSTNWVSVSNRVGPVLALKTDGSIWGWGCNSFGNLGVVNKISFSSPVRESSSSSDWCHVASGYNAFSAIKTNGTLWGSGRNFDGELGTNNRIEFSSPVQEFTSSTDWCCSSLGSFRHQLLLKNNGTVWSLGNNFCGKLGIGVAATVFSSPVQEISSSTNWSQISAGGDHSIAIKTDGSLWSWGNRVCGRLGDAVCFGGASSPVREWHSASNWATASAANHSVGTKTDGTIWTWGVGCFGSLGNFNNFSSCPCIRIQGTNYLCGVASSGFHSVSLRVTQ